MKALAAVLAASFLCLAACHDDRPPQGPAERAGEKLDDAAQKVKDGAKDVRNDVKEGAKDVKNEPKK